MTCKIFSAKELCDKIAYSNSIQHMLSLDSRFKFYEMAGEDSIDPEHGYVPSKKTIFIPVMLPNIKHEIAHMVEMTLPNRLLLPDWGMPKINKELSKFSEQGFIHSLVREIRVRAIQLHLESNWAVSERCLSFIKSECIEKEIKSRLPFGKFKNFAQVIAWMEHLRDTTYYAWSEERIVFEWEKRISYIQNWMETN